MPLIDMPVEELLKYQGRNPRPADFDEYWDNALVEMRAIDPKPNFKPFPWSCKVADAFELTFDSTKGARIYAKFLKPKNIEGKVPAILTFHGLSGESWDWTSLIPYAAQGYVVASLDTRGQGGYSQDAGSKFGTTFTTPFMRGLDGDPSELYVRDTFLDTAMLARIVMGLDYVDETRIGTTGGSQGGALSLACAALVPEIKLCAPKHPYLCDYKRVWEMDLATGAYEGLRYYFRHLDPRHERENEIFTKLGYIDLQFLAPRIKAKVMLATGLMDTICPPSTQFAMYNKLTCEKSYIFYPDYAHENLHGQDIIDFEFFAQL